MPAMKRRRGTIKKYKSSGVTGKMRRRVFKRQGRAVGSRLNQRVTQLYRMIETKESQRRVQSVLGGVQLVVGHNNTFRADLNPFFTGIGGNDEMVANTGDRIGDSIALKGMMIRAFFQNAFNRSKVYWRVMFVRSAKGDTPTRDTLFKNSSNNKMIDQVNVERYTVLQQKIFNITAPNSIASGAGVTGEVFGGTVAGIGTRTFKMWIPGRFFGNGGIVHYENKSNSQIKFYDYHVMILCYDWLYTPQDVNNVGVVNELYTKIYYKDA